MDDANKVVKYEDMVDNLEEELREKHMNAFPDSCAIRQAEWHFWILSAIWSVSLTMLTIWQAYVMSEQ